jgi:hypothetical protein
MNIKEEYLYKQLFENAEYFECNNLLHIGHTTTVKIGQNVAHPLCGRRLRKWVGFNELMYAKSSFYCDTCFLLYAILQLGKKVQSPTTIQLTGIEEKKE